MNDFFGHLKTAISLLKKTIPFLILRLSVYGIFALATLIYFLIIGGLAYLIHAIAGLIFLAGIGIYGVIVYYIREYLLYLIKAAHIAVLTQIHLKNEIPDQQNQVTYGKDFVQSRIKNISVLFAVDQLIKGILRSLNRTIVTVADWIPLPGLDNLANIAMKIINLSVTYVDEAILSYNLSKNLENPWQGAKEGIILYAQSYKNLLKSALFLGILGFFTFILFLIILLIPGIILASLLPSLKVYIGISIIVISYIFKLALYNPLAMATILVVFHHEIEGQTPDPAWEAKLDQISTKFKDLKNKAHDWIQNQTPHSSNKFTDDNSTAP